VEGENVIITNNTLKLTVVIVPKAPIADLSENWWRGGGDITHNLSP